MWIHQKIDRKKKSPWLIAIYIPQAALNLCKLEGEQEAEELLLVFVGCMSISNVLLIEKRATVNEHPPVHHEE